MGKWFKLMTIACLLSVLVVALVILTSRSQSSWAVRLEPGMIFSQPGLMKVTNQTTRVVLVYPQFLGGTTQFFRFCPTELNLLGQTTQDLNIQLFTACQGHTRWPTPFETDELGSETQYQFYLFQEADYLERTLELLPALNVALSGPYRRYYPRGRLVMYLQESGLTGLPLEIETR